MAYRAEAIKRENETTKLVNTIAMDYALNYLSTEEGAMEILDILDLPADPEWLADEFARLYAIWNAEEA